MDLSIRSETFGGDDQTWRASAEGTDSMQSITLDSSAFTSGTHYPNGFLESGTPLAKITATGIYGPYTPASDEVAVISTATSGNTTVTYDGESTAALALTNTTAVIGDVATLQTALNGLSNVSSGQLVVTLGSGGTAGKLIVTAGGSLANTDIGTIAATGTGAGAVITPGGDVTSGLEAFAGFLGTPVKVPTDTTIDVQGPLQWEGAVIEANLPIAVDAVAKASEAGRHFRFF